MSRKQVTINMSALDTPSSVGTPKGGAYTVEQALDYMGFGKFQVLLVVYSALAWIGDAMEMMILSFIGPAAKCHFDLTAVQEGWITSVVFIGMLFGAYFWGLMSDVYGRKTGFAYTAAFTAAAGLASAFSPSYGILLLTRGLVGFGLGGVPVAFTWTMEFLPAESRGQILSIGNLFWTVGAVATAGLAWAFLPISGTNGWRILLALTSIPLALMMCLFPLLFESPSWLATKGRRGEAEAVLHNVSKMNAKPLPPGEMECKSTGLPPALSAAGGAKPSALQRSRAELRMLLAEMGTAYRTMFGPGLRLSTCLVLPVWFVCALTYYGIVLLTTSLKAEESGACNPDGTPAFTNSDYSSILVSSLGEIPGQLIVLFYVDRWGRKPTLFASVVLSVASLGALLGALQFSTPTDWFENVMLFTARMGATALFITIYIYTPETYPTTIRAFGLGLCSSFARLGGLTAPFLSVDLLAAGYEELAIGIMILLLLAAGVLIIALPYETKGRMLKESQSQASMYPVGHGGSHNDINLAQFPKSAALNSPAGGAGGRTDFLDTGVVTYPDKK